MIKYKGKTYSYKEYGEAYPRLMKEYKKERKELKREALKALKEKGQKIGDMVYYDIISPFGSVEPFEGKITLFKGIPYVVRYFQGRRRRIRWHKGFEKLQKGGAMKHNAEKYGWNDTIQEVRDIIRWQERKIKRLEEEGIVVSGHLEGQLEMRKRRLNIMLAEQKNLIRNPRNPRGGSMRHNTERIGDSRFNALLSRSDDLAHVYSRYQLTTSQIDKAIDLGVDLDVLIRHQKLSATQKRIAQQKLGGEMPETSEVDAYPYSYTCVLDYDETIPDEKIPSTEQIHDDLSKILGIPIDNEGYDKYGGLVLISAQSLDYATIQELVHRIREASGDDAGFIATPYGIFIEHSVREYYPKGYKTAYDDYYYTDGRWGDL